MKQRKSISEIQKNLSLLNDERSNFEKQNEDYKRKISEEIKKFKNTEITNTPLVEKKYSLWQRILKTLGMN
jgi:hypothetical protein